MKLIAESGGSKTSWCGITNSGETDIISTIGLNPNFVPGEVFREVISSEVLPALKDQINEIKRVWFYGAGCAGRVMNSRVTDDIRFAIPSAEVSVYSDLLGAARGLLGKSRGYVCMIGTGSNSGYYDGEKITANVPPLGFILGDEGSGASLGKKLLADFLRGIMPADLSRDFKASYGAEKDDIVGHVYRGVFPSKYIGGFVQFLNDHISHGYCRDLIRKSFEEFVDRNLSLYKISGKTDIAVTGSVAWHFRPILEEVFRDDNFTISIMARGPIEGLIRYHKMYD
ncbi:MAG: ATPase [Bacteroidota bacterium]|nr:ATPase [Bacteroidota bacterium]